MNNIIETRNRSRSAYFFYGLLAYVAAVATIAYSILFLGNLFVSRTIDAVAVVPFSEAIVVNVALLLLFALQHSGMARKPFKRWVARHLDPDLERSTYVLASSVATMFLFTLWQPIGGIVWAVSNSLLSNLMVIGYFAGWTLMITATFLLDHLELFGLRQAWTASQGDSSEPSEFRTPGLYRHVRHPIYLGWLIVVWAAPVMTLTHLVFAAGMTVYMLIGIQLEENDLVVDLPDYQQYKRKVPMLLPSWRKHLE